MTKSYGLHNSDVYGYT